MVYSPFAIPIMSGFEVVGAVLGAIPLLVKALELYSEGVGS